VWQVDTWFHVILASHVGDGALARANLQAALDWSFTLLSAQEQRLFERHLEVAGELGLPVVIHCREAEEATVQALTAFEGTVVLHCFSSPALLPSALERGWYVSFAGNVTYPKAEDLRTAAAQVPGDRILAETDTPYLSPQPKRGRPNEPANVIHTLEELAAVRGVGPHELAAQIDANADAAFSLR